MNDALNAAKRVGGTLSWPSHGRSAFGMSWTSRDGAWQRQGQTLGHSSCVSELLFLAAAAAGEVTSMSGASGRSLAGSCNVEVRFRSRVETNDDDAQRLRCRESLQLHPRLRVCDSSTYWYPLQMIRQTPLHAGMVRLWWVSPSRASRRKACFDPRADRAQLDVRSFQPTYRSREAQRPGFADSIVRHPRWRYIYIGI